MADDALRGDLANATDTTKGATLVGYTTPGVNAVAQTVRKKLDSQIVDARDFGFSITASSTDNAQAIVRALVAANGKRVVVEHDDDFACYQMSLADEYDVDLEFHGRGRLQRLTGGALNISGTFVGLQSVSAITDGSAVVNSVTESLTKIFIADTSEYMVGDKVKIVSDDLDPDARGESSRRGEVTVVVLVDPDGVWVPRTLEDQPYYVTNVRMARFSRRRVRVKGLVVQSSKDNIGYSIVGISAIYRPDVSVEVYDHASTALHFRGCVSGTATVCGTGISGKNADGAKTLSYMFVDSSGKGNTLMNSVCSGQRHLVTTLFSDIAENSTILQAYGAPRDLHVWNCTSFGSQNTAFDEHEGARRTVFNRCRAYGGLKGTNSARVAFQLRGRDSQILDCYVDQSHEYAVNIAAVGRGTHRIRGGDFRVSSGILNNLANAEDRPDVIIDGVNVVMPSISTSGFVSTIGNNRVTVQNARFEAAGTTSSSPRLFQSRDNGKLHIANTDVTVVGSGNATFFDGLVVTGSARLTGDLRISSSGNSLRHLIGYTAYVDATTDVRIDFLAGAFAGAVAVGTDARVTYTVTDYTQSPPVTLKRVDALVMTAADPINNRSMSFTLKSDTVATLKVRGSDGVVRSVDLTLT